MKKTKAEMKKENERLEKFNRLSEKEKEMCKLFAKLYSVHNAIDALHDAFEQIEVALSEIDIEGGNWYYGCRDEIENSEILSSLGIEESDIWEYILNDIVDEINEQEERR